MKPAQQKVYVKLAWVSLVITVLVILWGAVVRSTGSGAGCGSHWPLCNGEVVPQEPGFKTLVELSHRVTSGIAFLIVVAQTILAFKWFPKGSPVRRFAKLSLLFMVVESLVGALIVILRLVGDNSSLARAIVIALHLSNTFLLLGAMTLLLKAARGMHTIFLPLKKHTGWLILSVSILFLLSGASGAIVALGNTLFPSPSLVAGLQADFDATSHFLIRLRVIHPIIAIFAGIVAWGFANRYFSLSLAKVFGALIAGQFVFGFLGVLLLAPFWQQLTHLFLADVLWIVWVWGASQVDEPAT